MTKKQIFAVVMYMAAVIGPAAALIARFGLQTNIDVTNSADALEQLLGLGGALAAGFVVSVGASRLVSAETENLTTLALTILRNQRSN